MSLVSDSFLTQYLAEEKRIHYCPCYWSCLFKIYDIETGMAITDKVDFLNRKYQSFGKHQGHIYSDKIGIHFDLSEFSPELRVKFFIEISKIYWIRGCSSGNGKGFWCSGGTYRGSSTHLHLSLEKKTEIEKELIPYKFAP